MYIYKIENKINNKCYIGQTSNIERRFKEHREGFLQINPTKALYIAFKKYGLENFSFTVIERVKKEEANEKENYYIMLFNSLSNGYNMVEGGNVPPTFYGEEHPNSKLTEEDVFKIAEILSNTDKPMIEIAFDWKISKDQIYRINTGEAWNYYGFNYPLRRTRLGNEQVENIKFLLKSSNLTQKAIGAMFGVSRTTITAINQGQNHFDKEETYPLRTGRRYQQK